jgi:hypothetical protein
LETRHPVCHFLNGLLESHAQFHKVMRAKSKETFVRMLPEMNFNPKYLAATGNKQTAIYGTPKPNPSGVISPDISRTYIYDSRTQFSKFNHPAKHKSI